MAKVAFLGAGAMGRGMARNLIEAGHQVCLYNRTAKKAKPLAEAGARLAQTPAEAASGADFIVSMVGDVEASRAVWLGPGGALSGELRANAIAVESSTLSRDWVVELAAKVREAGLRFIDCPLTGGPDVAAAGTLTLLVGAEAETLDEARALFSAYSDRIIHFGPVGSGAAYKVMVNLIGAVQAVALAEGLLVAERAGLDLEKVSEALSSGAVASPHVKYLVERMAGCGGHDDVYFSARWRHKDATYGLRLAEELGQSMPTSAAAEKVYSKVIDKGLGDKNSSVVIEVLRE